MTVGQTLSILASVKEGVEQREALSFLPHSSSMGGSALVCPVHRGTHTLGIAGWAWSLLP